MSSSRTRILFAGGIILTAGLFVADLMAGSADIPLKDTIAALAGRDTDSVNARIILNIRLVKAIVAMLAGAALSVSGLQMQTMFKNPLAGPSVLGLTSGASLGAAIFIIGMPLLPGLSNNSIMSLGTAGAAWVGAALIMGLIIAIGHRIKDIMVILILGMMISSGISSVVQILQFLSDSESLKTFVVWTMGSLADVTYSQMSLLVPAFAAGIALSILAIKPLNLMLLGDNYARSMGLDLRKSRTIIFVSVTLLAGSVTAFCGPISFIGLAVPHITRFIFRTADHSVLIPGTIVAGMAMLLLCDIISKIFILPINTITSLIGIPVVIWVIIRNKRIA